MKLIVLQRDNVFLLKMLPNIMQPVIVSCVSWPLA